MADFLCQNEGTVYEAVAYYRLSKYAKSNDSESIANQRKLVREYLSRHPEILLVDEQEDDGFTGTNYERPGFQAVMRAIREKRANCVIVKDLSRLGREYIETGKYLERVFPAMGVRFISINDDVDSERERAGDDIIIPVKNIMNEAYCRELSRKLRRQFEVQRSRGEYVGSFVSYGYLKDPRDKHKLIPDEYAAEVVRGIFQLKIKGYSAQTIADHLNENGVLSPSQYKKQMGSRYKSGFQNGSISEWGPMTIRRILTNEIYMGTLIQGKRGTPNYKIKQMRLRDESKWSVVPHLGYRIHGKIKRDKIGRNKTQRPEESWQIIENAHPAIVERELFEKIQRINQEKLAKRERYGACNEVTVDHRSLFRGKVVCGECGHLLTAAKGCARPGAKSGSRVFFDCSTYKKSNHTQCSSHYIRQETLFHAIQHTLDQQVRIAVDFGKMLADVQKMPTIKAAKSAQTKKQVSLRVKRQNIENKLEQLLHDLTTGLITRDEYEYIKRRYNEQYAQIQSEEIALRETMKVAERQLRSAEQWLAEVKRYQKIPVIDRPMIDLLIREIKVFQDRSVKIELNYADPCQPLYAYMDLYTEERHAV